MNLFQSLWFLVATIILGSCGLESDISSALALAELAPNHEKTVGESYAELCNEIVAESNVSPAPFTIGELERRFLDLHNRDRRRFGLSDLVWDQNLANYAQRWANHLKDSFGCEMRHRSQLGQTEGKMLGENLAFYWTSQTVPSGSFASTPDLAINNWDAECDAYDLVSNSCQTGKQCGHFTQVVWESTKRVGCGVAVCNAGDNNYFRGGRAEIWVCNYDPPGNMSINTNGVITKLKPFSEAKPLAASAAVSQRPIQPKPVIADDQKPSTSLGQSSTARVVLYGNPKCGLCVAARRVLDEKQVTYEFVDIFANTELLRRLHTDIGPRRFPYVFVDGKFVGGLTELSDLLTSNRLTKPKPSTQARKPAQPSKGALGQSPKRVVLYVNTPCENCAVAKELLTQKGTSFEQKFVQKNSELMHRLHKEIGIKSYPYIFVDGEFIGGLKELRRIIRSKRLDPAAPKKIEAPKKPRARHPQKGAQQRKAKPELELFGK